MTVLTHLVSALAVLGQVNALPSPQTPCPTVEETVTARQNVGPKPFWAIAHRVLTSNSVKAALSHGANALEIDFQPWPRSGWWADHDGLAASAGDRAEDIFKTIAQARRDGQNVGFVWLDIKGPDHCGEDSPNCHFNKLRDMAREILQPAGVKVLYGFYDGNSKAFASISAGLNEMEGLNINGKSDDVQAAYAKVSRPTKAQKTMAYGYFNLPFQFGSCDKNGRYSTCDELAKAAASSQFGAVYGWTSVAGQKSYVDKMIDAGVDGIIYGFKATYYYDHASARSAFDDIKRSVEERKNTRYLAKVNDQPW